MCEVMERYTKEENLKLLIFLYKKGKIKLSDAAEEVKLSEKDFLELVEKNN